MPIFTGGAQSVITNWKFASINIPCSNMKINHLTIKFKKKTFSNIKLFSRSQHYFYIYPINCLEYALNYHY